MKEAFDLIKERLEKLLGDTNFEKATQEVNESFYDGLAYAYGQALSIVPEVEAEYGNPKTNADHIRSMSDEELAEFFARKSPCDYYCNYSKRACNGVSCKQGILDWLKSNTTD